jgi:SNF family Na+-dependent transporter
MNKYNKIMLYLWLTVAIASAIIVTFKGISEGFERWYSYYIISAISFFMYIVRRWMIKRMEKHLEYLKNNSN